ncbi:hypothetical protein [Variovorax paradoxus]|uniref:hypothetical protein n=1 Tax=Variovorax paradoxus TaxID=34073 RepID=UPI0011852BC8|nr:hypothetical protein [Variovorax paradoxus]
MKVHHGPFQAVVEYLAASVIVRDIGLAHLIPHIQGANFNSVRRIEFDAAMSTAFAFHSDHYEKMLNCPDDSGNLRQSPV